MLELMLYELNSLNHECRRLHKELDDATYGTYEYTELSMKHVKACERCKGAAQMVGMLVKGNDLELYYKDGWYIIIDRKAEKVVDPTKYDVYVIEHNRTEAHMED